MAIPNAKNAANYGDASLRELKHILATQQDELNKLNYLVETIYLEKNYDFNSQIIEEYEKKIEHFTYAQLERFTKIDELINQHILAVKKGKPSNENILLYGKEVRKVEAGLRTIKLFLCDIIKMLEHNKDMRQRLEDRTYYFKHRHQQTSEEIVHLSNQIQTL